MKADYLNYQRATRVSLAGLAIQFVLAAGAIIYAQLAGDRAAFTLALYIAVGIPAWLILAVVFDQHRRERIEAIEAETFAQSDAATSSVFDDSGSDLRVAAKRLAMMYRLLLPACSLLIAATLIGIGAWRSVSGKGVPEDGHGSAIAVGLSMAFVGFIFARFVAGMAKQEMWQNLRAGAAFAVGSALGGLLMAVAHFAEIAGSDALLRILGTVYPVASIVLGIEIVLNFLLEIYRPRKAGEHGRIALDSRLLGFIAAPDKIAESIGEAINYQFGYDVQKTWVYEFLAKWWPAMIGVTLLVIWLQTSLVVVHPHQRGLLLTFGKVAEEQVEPGWHFKAPWPIQEVLIPEHVVRDADGSVVYRSRTATGIRTLHLGTPPPKEDSGPILWSNEHSMQELHFLCQPATLTRQLSDDTNYVLVSVEVPLRYVVEDVTLYEMLGEPDERDDILQVVGQREVMRFLAGLTVDEILGSRRDDLSGLLMSRLQEAYSSLNPDDTGTPRGAGIRIVQVGAEGVHPPRRVATPFERVVQAQLKRDANIDAAEAHAIGTLTQAAGGVEEADEIGALIDDLQSKRGTPEAADLEARIIERIKASGGAAAREIVDAEATRWETFTRAWGESARYTGLVELYEAAPELFRMERYIEALAEMTEGARVFIVDDKIDLRVDLNAETKDATGEIFQAEEDF